MARLVQEELRALRAVIKKIDLTAVKHIRISFDPFHKNTESLR